MSSFIFWRANPVPHEPGETVAAALRRAGIVDLGQDAAPIRGRVFCGIGTCQSCLVTIDGHAPVEACLTIAREGMRIEPAGPGITEEAHG